MKDFWKGVWDKFSSVISASLIIFSIMCVVLVIFSIMCVVLVISGCVSLPDTKNESDLIVQSADEKQSNNTENRRRISGSGWGVCDITDYTDPETGVHYLLYDGDSGVGICPRYDKNGALMITEVP